MRRRSFGSSLATAASRRVRFLVAMVVSLRGQAFGSMPAAPYAVWVSYRFASRISSRLAAFRASMSSTQPSARQTGFW